MSMLRRFVAARWIPLWGCLAVCLSPAAAVAGAQGPGLPLIEGPDDGELTRFWMNEPGLPVPSFVCVDDPSIACFDLELDDTGTPEILRSPDCPGTQACRPAEISGTAMTATLTVQGLPEDQWTRTDVSDLYPYNGCEFGGGHNTTALSPASLDLRDDPAVGTVIYADSPFYTLFSIPSAFGCSQWIRTELGAANSANATEISFTLGRYEYVYVAYQDDAVQPTWLQSSDWIETGEIVQTRFQNFSTIDFRVYRSSEILDDDSSVALPGNNALGGDADFHYLVFVRPPSATEYCGHWGGALTLDTPAGPVITQSFFEQGCGIVDESTVAIQPPILLPGGLGWYTGGPLTCTGSLVIGETLQYERAFGPTGILDRAALISAAQAGEPALCDPAPNGSCQLEPALTLVGTDGAMEVGSQTADPSVCTFTTRFTEPGQTRMVIHGESAEDVDNTLARSLVETRTGAGVIDDVDVWLRTSLPFADNLVAYFFKDTTLVELDDRDGCNTLFSTHNIWYDDDSALPYQSACGTTTGTRQPLGSLGVLDGDWADGLYAIQIFDDTSPGNGTDVLGWEARVSTRHTECSDDIDNDGDGFVDADGGPLGGSPDANCSGPGDDRESPSPAPGACGVGPELAPLLALLAWARRRARAFA